MYTISGRLYYGPYYYFKDQPYWIGLHDLNEEGNFHWLDEEREVSVANIESLCHVMQCH